MHLESSSQFRINELTSEARQSAQNAQTKIDALQSAGVSAGPAAADAEVQVVQPPEVPSPAAVPPEVLASLGAMMDQLAVIQAA